MIDKRITIKGIIDSIESIDDLMIQDKGEKQAIKDKNNMMENNTSMHHTAMTYSSIQKIKNKDNEKEKMKPKIKVITDRKLYNGKVDRVKLFQMMKSEWKKSPFLKK